MHTFCRHDRIAAVSFEAMRRKVVFSVFVVLLVALQEGVTAIRSTLNTTRKSKEKKYVMPAMDAGSHQGAFSVYVTRDTTF